MPSLAIVGTGIAGLGCARFLHRHHDITVLEQENRLGGHTHTVDVDGPDGKRATMDTGFMVFNRVTYPHLTRLFTELGVPVKPTSMSFSVRHAATGLEFAGSSLNHLFAQRRNLVRPRFWRMLRAINRFNQEAIAALEDPAARNESLGDYVRRRGYGTDFLDLYLVPMSSAVWSTPPELMLAFPATTLLRFFHNHGFLGLHTQHPWWTVDGGARNYVERLVAPFRDRIRTGEGVTRVARGPGGVRLTLRSGREETFDRTATRRCICWPTRRPTNGGCWVNSAASPTPRPCTRTSRSCPAPASRGRAGITSSTTTRTGGARPPRITG